MASIIRYTVHEVEGFHTCCQVKIGNIMNKKVNDIQGTGIIEMHFYDEKILNIRLLQDFSKKEVSIRNPK